jgi:hypothetical protein
MCFRYDDNDQEVNFLRRSNNLGDKFIKPEIEDRAPVHEKQIEMILPRQAFCGQTTRQKS